MLKQYAVQCFRWEAAAGIHIPHRTHGRQMAISLHLKVGIVMPLITHNILLKSPPPFFHRNLFRYTSRRSTR